MNIEINQREFIALCQVVDMFMEDEQKDAEIWMYEEMGGDKIPDFDVDDEPEDGPHIYFDLRTIDKLIHKIKNNVSTP